MKLFIQLCISVLLLSSTAFSSLGQWRTVSTSLTGSSVWYFDSYGSGILASTNSGIYKSDDNGMTWNYFGLAGYDVYFITVNDTDIFASTWGNGLLRSSDGGSTWNMLGNGINTLYITTTFINGTDLFVCADDGLYFSNNYGSGFTQLNMGVSTGVNFLLINDSMLIAATYNGVFKSDDYGSTWSATPVFSGLNVWQVFNSGGILFAGTSGSGLYT